MRRFLPVLVVLVSLPAVSWFAAQNQTHIVIMHTNDLHGQLLPRDGVGGIAEIAAIIRAAKIGPDDEVVTTPLSFVASANCMLYEGARPVFVDIDESSMNLDASLLAGAITPRTRAILPVHIFGQPCAMQEIVALAAERSDRLARQAASSSLYEQA